MDKPVYSKYGNRKVRCQGEAIDPLSGQLVMGNLRFDSEDEADYYFCLIDQYKAGDADVTEVW